MGHAGHEAHANFFPAASFPRLFSEKPQKGRGLRAVTDLLMSHLSANALKAMQGGKYNSFALNQRNAKEGMAGKESKLNPG